MASWTPSAPFTVPMTVLTPSTSKVNGVLVKGYADGRAFTGSFRTFGGTERVQDGLTVVEDTAVVETWYSPDLVAGCRVRTDEDGAVWDVLGTPEDIGQRHQWMRFKVRRAKGGA